jgi:uncharacterized protein involved in response to NO
MPTRLPAQEYMMNATTGGVPRYRPFTGPVFLQEGFRPFFLGAALWSALALCLWLGSLVGHVALPTAFDALTWHGHEMIFGFAVAAVSGFLLTAIPNWTGRLPLQGGPLAVLALTWLAGRAAVTVSAWIGAPLAAAVDLAFLILLLMAVLREVAAGRNWRNLPMPMALGLLIAANLLVHLEALDVAETAALGLRLAMSVLLMLIALVGGRIIPSFTRNWLAKRGVTPLPAGFGAVDKVALVAGAVGLAGWVAAAEPSITGAALIVAGLAAALRLARWRGYRTAAEPLVWVLHAGHGWLALGLFLLGLSHLWAAVPSAAALHALTAGAIGTMILAVMTRATRGHTGRALAAGLGTTSIYLLVTAAAALRVAAAVATGLYLPLLIASGAAWVGAFLLFMALYGMPLLTPRLKTSEPGT